MINKIHQMIQILMLNQIILMPNINNNNNKPKNNKIIKFNKHNNHHNLMIKV